MCLFGDLRFPFNQDTLRRFARIHEYKSRPTHYTRHLKVGLFTFFFARLHLAEARVELPPPCSRRPTDTQADMMPTRADLVTPHDNGDSAVTIWIAPHRSESNYPAPGCVVVSHIACVFRVERTNGEFAGMSLTGACIGFCVQHVNKRCTVIRRCLAALQRQH